MDPYWDEEAGSRDDLFAGAEAALRPLARGRLTFRRARSWDAAEAEADASFDVVFLDGMHDFPNVYGDATRWSRKVRGGGVLAGHDFSPEHPAVVRVATYVCSVLGRKLHLGGDTVWYC